MLFILLSGGPSTASKATSRSEEHTSELQSHSDLVCRLLLEIKSEHVARDLTHLSLILLEGRAARVPPIGVVVRALDGGGLMGRAFRVDLHSPARGSERSTHAPRAAARPPSQPLARRAHLRALPLAHARRRRPSPARNDLVLRDPEPHEPHHQPVLQPLLFFFKEYGAQVV